MQIFFAEKNVKSLSLQCQELLTYIFREKNGSIF